MADIDEVLAQTLELLEWRLRRIEFVLDGDVKRADEKPTQSVLHRIHNIEDALANLSSKSRLINEAIQLQSKYPELLEPPGEDTSAELENTEKMAMVLMEAPAFQSTTSQLNSLSDLPVPPTDGFASLIALQPRISQVEQRQIQQAMEISELRKRSGALILRWHEIFVLGQGRCWAEWDTRMTRAERSVRREEVRIAKENEE